MAAELIALDALGPSGAYRARRRLTIPDVAGNPVAELSLVPKLFVNRSISMLRKAPTLPLEERLAALARAARIFLQDTVANLSFADWRDPLTREGRAVWTRRGDVFAVHAAGNHPGPHALWLEALALGYRVAVRPSRREPFTPHRLVSALRAAGFGEDRVVLLPTDHDGADEILRSADLGMVYGGDDVVRKYAADTSVLPQGPGRSKILITAGIDWRAHLDTIVDSISYHGGVACINTTSVLVEVAIPRLWRALLPNASPNSLAGLRSTIERSFPCGSSPPPAPSSRAC